MSTTSKSPVAVARQALRIAQKAHLPLYSHKNSPKTYTQHQHLAILVLMRFFGTDYRGIEQYLHDLSDLRKALGLRDVPDHSTLAKAQKRLLARPLYQRLLAASTARRGRPRRVQRAALDSTGFATCHASHYYVRRRRSRDHGRWEKAVYRTYGKLGVVWDCSDHMILATEETRGPAVDINRFVPLLQQASAVATLETALADVGYDSEGNHRHAREVLGVRSVIPAKKTKNNALPKGHWRRRMKLRLNKDYCPYGQRAQAETGNSMVKRRQRSTLPGRTAWSQRRDLRLMVLTHNAMILYLLGTFRQSWSDPATFAGSQVPRVCTCGQLTKRVAKGLTPTTAVRGRTPSIDAEQPATRARRRIYRYSKDPRGPTPWLSAACGCRHGQGQSPLTPTTATTATTTTTTTKAKGSDPNGTAVSRGGAEAERPSGGRGLFGAPPVNTVSRHGRWPVLSEALQGL